MLSDQAGHQPRHHDLLVEVLLDQAGVAAGSTSPINHQLNP